MNDRTGSTSSGQGKPLARTWMAAALLAICVASLYANSFPGAFHYDDQALMLSSPKVTSSFPYGDFLRNYGGRPLTLWTFHWTHRSFGDDPLPYHAISVALHVVVCVLLYFCLAGGPLAALSSALRPSTSQASDPAARAAESSPFSPAMAFAGALLFAVHPLQNQAVNYIWSRSMLLMAAFMLAALLTIRRNRAIGLLFWQLAMWSRMDALVALPLLLWRNRKAGVGLMVVGVLNIVGFAWGASRLAADQVPWRQSDALPYLLALPMAVVEYLRLVVWPSDLHLDRSFGPYPPWASPLAAALLLAAAVWLWRNRAGYPAVAFGMSWWLVWLAPSLAMPNADLVTESRAYLAMAGLSVAVAGVSLPSVAWKARALRVGWAAAVVGLAAITLVRNPIWSRPVELFRDAVLKSPEKGRLHYNLGSALAQRGLNSEAEAAFQEAVRLEPDNDLGYSALGYCAEVQARPREAVVYYRKALRINPRNERALEGLRRLRAARNEDES